MGFKLALIMGVLLIGVSSGSVLYIKYLNAQLVVSKGNQVVLEAKISDQNESIKLYLEKQASVSIQLAEMEDSARESMREVSRLQATFSRHSLNNLAMMKPGLIENRVNRGTARVMKDLIDLTNPNQFDDQNEKTTTSD